mmetsp:Transcript_3558/g.5266  ORF Transcript_3558/g.5266 Transcript_3558/m.5266 type:complete len:117 (+) Transcript_3558:127-477(+)|eukprot:CAMPEP_0194210838 /NCGR_PEP_ID=MMETSP0156-20130528/9142_1 /TAXON_ID=33649 /ORGANISM="Thalassionema nitzschioides, Strain L26-B" /LENGTH=116 /DNA_ID=CAMNT_0038938245 /DNA_START=127 /DNA_END=477 /DNA_ORIENTATION=-
MATLLSKTIMSSAARQFSNNMVHKAHCPTTMLQTPHGLQSSSFSSATEISQVRSGIQDIMDQVQELREIMKEAENLSCDLKVNISEVDEMKAKLMELESRMTHIDLAMGFLPKHFS